MSPQTLFRQETGKCIPNNQCYAGNDAKKDCCSGHVITSVGCGLGAMCDACKGAVKVVVDNADKGCPVIVPMIGGVCSPLGPFAGLCNSALTTGCQKLVDMVVKQGLKDPQALCAAVDMCSGGSGGFTVSECNCVKKGDCTFWQAGCCSGSSDWSWKCTAMGLSECK